MIAVINDLNPIEENTTPNDKVHMLILQLKDIRHHKIFQSIHIFPFIDANIFAKIKTL